MQPIKKHKSRVSVIQIDENEDFIITGEDKGAIIYWDIDERLQKIGTIKLLMNHDDMVTDVCFKTQMGLFASSSLDGTINMYRKQDQYMLRTFFNPSKDVRID